MDPQHALQIARDLLVWAGPLVAGGALAQAGAEATDQSTQLAQRAWRAIQGWLARDADAADDLRKLEKRPEDTDRQQIVAKALAQIAASDAAVAQELAALKHALSQLQPGAGSRTHQAFVSDSAQVGVLNVGDLHGGLTVGPIDFSKRTIISTPIGTPRPGAPTSAAAPAPARPALPTTLSADGTHFSYGHALLIGVGSYQRAALSVETTAADAVQLGALLCDPQCGGYPPAQVRVLSDAQATRAGMLAAFATFAQQLAQAPRATAIVFFAGHGQQRGEDFFLLPHDYNPDAVDASAISAAEFHACIAALRPHAQKLLVVLNCCHSGGIGAAVLGTGAAGGAADGTAGATPPAAFYQPLVAGSGQVVISAARPGQKAGADAWSAPAHTLFGARLLAALRGQAPGDAPGIGVFELFGYLSTHVPADARQIHYNGAPLAQEPLLYAHQLDTNIAIALRPNWQGGTLAADLATTLEALVQAEIELASYAREADAPAALQQRRDALLAQLARAEPEH